ncbi:MAG: hypothetical protein K2Q27_01100 [Novosphingobium sp.]|uniref:hypothetical protein n=1 Tax=Novosphingobium sp. NDB2Meth1 TaxID=1892847 RepID=UPI00093196CA|nr:hypothetical protein [Novosphingobium sp. NDB2Meth1]MBY0391841.1 hypothetical protein [Novosphingobium sp.]
MPYLPNPGHLPPECEILDADGHVIGFRAVHVRLFNGWDSRKAGTSPWPSRDGRPPTNWSIRRPTPHPFDIKEFDPQ